MKLYEDSVVSLDDAGVTIKSYRRPGDPRTVAYGDVRTAELMDLRFGTGRYRLVGISPGRLRHFFHWDNGRRKKRTAISLDTGSFLKRAITPDDPATVLSIIEGRMPQP